jgi:hypothetical protein
MKNTRIRGRLHDHSSLTPNGRPATFRLPLVNDFVKHISRHSRALEMVASDTLHLLVGEGDGMLRERDGVHVRAQRCSDHRRFRPGEHFRPCAHVSLVDVFYNVFQAELSEETLNPEQPC